MEKFKDYIIKRIEANHLFRDPTSTTSLKDLEDHVTAEIIFLKPKAETDYKKDVDFENQLVQDLIQTVQEDPEVAYRKIEPYDAEGEPKQLEFWHNSKVPDYIVKTHVRTLSKKPPRDKEIIQQLSEKELNNNFVLIQTIDVVGRPADIEKIIDKYILFDNTFYEGKKNGKDAANAVLGAKGIQPIEQNYEQSEQGEQEQKPPKEPRKIKLYSSFKPLEDIADEEVLKFKIFNNNFDGEYLDINLGADSETEHPHICKDTELRDFKTQNIIRIYDEEAQELLDKILSRKYGGKTTRKVENLGYDELTKILLFELQQRTILNVLNNPGIIWKNFSWLPGSEINVYAVLNKEKNYELSFRLSEAKRTGGFLGLHLSRPDHVALIQGIRGSGTAGSINYIVNYFSLLNKPLRVPVDSYGANGNSSGHKDAKKGAKKTR